MKKQYFFYGIFIVTLFLISFWMQHCTQNKSNLPGIAQDPVIGTWEITEIMIGDQLLVSENEDCEQMVANVVSQQSNLFGSPTFEKKNKGFWGADMYFSWKYDLASTAYQIKFDESDETLNLIKKDKFLWLNISEFTAIFGETISPTTAKEFLIFWNLLDQCPSQFDHFADDAPVYFQYSKIE